ncbi:phage baseplate assembly protein V [Billgrantia gudaonensis]|uniref:Phage baseplate assembly protein V n=1 Tax=Billgrantia gudaonensis TaxID=376427 RepID=A0A1G9AYA6_9GAMM|nr:phage baseplate assembly protein V [Halomonas gudaonensis]SDK32309.1 phage baseplate assembly protein V [Halomonas gudaonensis]
MVKGREAYRLLSPLWRRLRLLISRAVVARSDSARGMQRLQLDLLRDETRDVEHHEPYGLTARPKRGAEAIAAAIGGARGHLVALVVGDRRYRLKGLKEGEVALYDDLGHKVYLTRQGIVIDGAGQDVTIVNAPTVHMPGDLRVAGDVYDGVSSMQAMRDVYNDHNHPENDSGGPTDTPNQEMS